MAAAARYARRAGRARRHRGAGVGRRAGGLRDGARAARAGHERHADAARRVQGAGRPRGQARPDPRRRVRRPRGHALRSLARRGVRGERRRAAGARGRACPPDSRLGAGTLTAMTGFGSPFDPVHSRLDLFRTHEGLIEVVTEPSTGAYLGSDRLTISGSRLTAHPPRTPGGPPDGETAVREIDWRVDRAGYVVAPPGCPASGEWVARATFTFDGAGETDTTTTPCEPGGTAATTAPAPAPGPSAPRSRGLLPALLVAPARVRARHTVRLVVQLAASSRCRRGALVRVAGRRARTDARGRAVLRVRLRRAGRYRVLAGRASCPRRSATITAT